MSIEQMKSSILKVYPAGVLRNRKLSDMCDWQITAIYYKLIESGKIK